MTTALAPAGGPTFDVPFDLPPERVAEAPPEARGGGRDDVRLLVARAARGRVEEMPFRAIARILRPGDLLVVNTSATLAAALPARRAGGADALLHLSTRLPGGLWLVEPRRPAGAGSLPEPDARPGERLALPEGAGAQLLAPFPLDAPDAGRRLWFAALDVDDLPFFLDRHGRPIRYGHAARGWPLAAYQTVFAREPGSAEMPSAARPFTRALVAELVARGIGIAPLVLHSGVASPEAGEAPPPEPYRVPAETAARVNAARGAGRRVIAVGTTVTRALETVAGEDGRVHAGAGWTELVLSEARPARAVDGLLTGWHEPGASHLALLAAVAPADLLTRSYSEALARGFLWHEFGDLHLLLP
jgi:S-adenosylmethionine:tRNA ribosyltransferase-isomerase